VGEREEHVALTALLRMVTKEWSGWGSNWC
jgi:hypothetical protein